MVVFYLEKVAAKVLEDGEMVEINGALVQHVFDTESHVNLLYKVQEIQEAKNKGSNKKKRHSRK